MLLFGELPDEKVSEACWLSKYSTYCRYIICSTISAWYMSAWDRMFDSYSNLAPQNRHLNFISLKFWIKWVSFHSVKWSFYWNFSIYLVLMRWVVLNKICVFYLMCPFIMVLQHGRCATLQCSYYIKYYISYITSHYAFVFKHRYMQIWLPILVSKR